MNRSTHSQDGAEAAPRRGRPPKFGRPGHVVAVTLPDDTLKALNQVDPDTGWAIVKLLERGLRHVSRGPRVSNVELVTIATRRSLIVVNRAVFKTLPGVNFVPFSETQAFLALEPGRGMSDVELAVIDRLSDKSIDAREHEALVALRVQLAAWRRDRNLAFHIRSIIVVEQVNGSGVRRPSKLRRSQA